jgi:hypothetical protein
MMTLGDTQELEEILLSYVYYSKTIMRQIKQYQLARSQILLFPIPLYTAKNNESRTDRLEIFTFTKIKITEFFYLI